jgi:geranylgeranyl transferase type-1 subunit beta
MSTLATGDAESGTSGFVWKAHGKFLQRFLVMLPDFLSSLDTQRPTIAFFAVSGLDLLGKLDESLNPEAKQRIIDWLYSLQVRERREKRGERGEESEGVFGFPSLSLSLLSPLHK